MRGRRGRELADACETVYLFEPETTRIARQDRVAKVEVAVLRSGTGVLADAPRCQWLNREGRYTSVKPSKHGCDQLVWLRAQGTTHWRYLIRDGLPRGHYFAYARATTQAGATDLTFTAKRGNKIPIDVR